MNSELSGFGDRLLNWAVSNWQILVAILAILVIGLYVRRLFGGRAGRRRPQSPAGRERPDTQALDVSVAAAAEITADIDAYARALFTEDMAALASRAAGAASQPLRFATISEAPFIYDGVIMRDLTLLPTPFIAPVGDHFRQAQTILDSLRRQVALNAPDATVEERIAALKTTAAALAQGVDKAVIAIEKLDAWIARNGGATEGARGLADLPVPALKNAPVDRLSQRTKTYRALREQAQARLAELDGMIESARRTGGPGGKLDMTLVALRPEERRAVKIEPAPPLKTVDKAGDKAEEKEKSAAE
ncbi:MAG: hypothetical protein J0H41_04680 [Rhizobiales bacterium]|nr:hypothetical protein [Hyphomicrobiales bacterium]